MTTDLPFRVLLYRYFFFLWLFRDAHGGTPLQRAAAWRHNQAQARWLPTYMRRWLVLGVTLYGMGAAVEQSLGLTVCSAFFYTPGALSVPVLVVLGVAWLGLRRFPAPL